MSRKRFFVGSIGSLAIVIAIAACGGGESTSTTIGDDVTTTTASQTASDQTTTTQNGTADEPVVVGWSPISNPTDPLRTWYDDQIKLPIEEAGGEVLYCSAENDAATQEACINSFVVRDVDAMIIWPVDVIATGNAIKAANDAGIPVFVFFGKIPTDVGAQVELTLATAGAEAGMRGGEHFVEVLTAKYGSPRGLVLELQGTMTQTDGIVRSQGLQEVLNQYPDIELVSKPMNWDASVAASIMRDWLTARPETDAIYSATDYYVPDEILKGLDRWVQISDPEWIAFTGMDGSNTMLNDIKNGFHQQTVDLGYTALPISLSNAVVEFLTTGALPQNGDVIETGNSTFPVAMVTAEDGVAGLILSIDPLVVTIENVGDPELAGNKFLPPPNGLSDE